MEDRVELIAIISETGSPKLWCLYLNLSESTCNRLNDHGDDNVALDLAQAYLDESVQPCWEVIVQGLCKFKKINRAHKLVTKHKVDITTLDCN